MVKILIGPVVGLVTEDTARVLIEFDTDVEGVMKVSEHGKQVKEVRRLFKGEVPACFGVSGLTKGKEYRYTITPGEGTEGSFMTMKGKGHLLRIAVGSCDKPTKRGKIDMFDEMYNKIRNRTVDIVIRNGDQVYADSAFAESVKIFKNKTSTTPSMEHKERLMLHEYQKIYRTTWTVPSVARCYANSSHLMILDDHEIRNDWGTFKHDDNKNHHVSICGQQGRKAYYLYQRQLWDTAINGDEGIDTYNPEHEGTVFTLNGSKIFLVDCRGSRSWGQPPTGAKLWLGSQQLSFIKDRFLNDLHGTDEVIMVHTTAPAYLSTKRSKCLSCLPPQVDKMGFGNHPSEQAAYFNILANWKSHSPLRRILLIGGDLHHHMSSTITGPTTSISQVVSSAISNSPPPCFAKGLIRCCLLCGPAVLEDDWSVKHTLFAYERNFLVVTCSCNGTGQMTYHVHTQSNLEGFQGTVL